MRVQRAEALLVLHGAPAEGAFHVWGESSRVRRTKKPALARGASAKTLIDALSSLDLRFDPRALERRTAKVWLPTVEEKATPSSRLIGDAVGGERRLAPWDVDALALDLDYAIELASLLGGERMIAPGVVLGRDFLFWQVVLRFAARLAADGRFLPSAGQAFGGWRALLDGEDYERLHALAKAMPGAARAIGEDPTQIAPLALVRDTVDRAVDLIATAASMRAPPPARSSGVHDRWVRALRGHGELELEESEGARLRDDCRQWLHPVERSAQLPYRLCVRIAEPNEDTDPWTIELLLQSKEDPSLLLSPGPILAGTDPLARETLLAFSSQAFRLVPELADRFDDMARGIPLTGAEALAFLRERAPVLESAGFRVMLPSWWTRRESTSLRTRAKIAPAKESGAGLTLDAVIKFDWEIALGDQRLTEPELKRLAQLKSPLVKMRGRWVFFDPKQLDAALRLAAEGRKKSSLGDLVRLALGAEAAPGELPFEGVDGEGSARDLIAALTGGASFSEIETPVHFSGTLRPYQQRGFSWLEFLGARGLGACLADDMGLGKTVQTLAAILFDRERDRRRVPYLLVCPTSVIGNWQRETARFTPSLRLLVHHGPDRAKTKKALSKARARKDLIITSYSLLSRDADLLTATEWSGAVLDEAQNVKNPDAAQSKAARALSAERRIALTGTPVENDVGELWSLMEFLNPGFLGGRTEFRKRFFVPIQASRDREAAEKLRRLTSPFILRRTKTDRTIIDDLPEKQEMDVYCHLTKEQASLYAAVVKEAQDDLQKADGMKRRGLILATLSKLKQICNHPAHFLRDGSDLAGRSGKLVRLEEMLAEVLEGGDRALLFTQFSEMGALLTEHLSRLFGREVAFLHGAVPKQARDEMVLRFQDDADGPPLFVLSLKAGGTGLNLTRASHVFFFDRWWNPAVENQAMDRAFRIGQQKNVQVHKLVCLGTLEEEICRMIDRKKAVAASVVATGEQWLTELSNEELAQIFALRSEAVME
jgi:SNF2 family DNA or RNA helicase